MPAVSVALARPGSRHLVRVITLFAVVLTFAALLLVGGPASAHDQLVSSDPKDGATLDEQPTSISLTFSAAPLDTGIEIALVGPDGTTARGYDIQVADEVVTAQLAPDLPAGKYDVAWHVVSSDGHPIDGELTYVVEGEPTAEPSDEPEMSTQEAEPTDAAPTDDGAQEPTTPTELAGAGDGAGPSGLAVAGGILAAVLVVLGVVVMMRRKILENDKLRQANEPDTEDPDAEKPDENPDDKPKA
jgi:methionine-rich copper-binding protein CopC